MESAYTDEEWSRAVTGRPLADLSSERFMTLHRHWIWADSAFQWFRRELETPLQPGDGVDLASDRWFSMYLWYSLLWAVIEGVQKDRVVVSGRFREDLRNVRDALREARNAVMHVSDEAYYDSRLLKIMIKPDSAAAVRRIHAGYARLFFTELQARRDTES